MDSRAIKEAEAVSTRTRGSRCRFLFDESSICLSKKAIRSDLDTALVVSWADPCRHLLLQLHEDQ